MSRKLSIISGLIIFLFVMTHLLNLSLGIFSLELLDSSRPYFFAVWSFLPIEILLMTAFIIHSCIALRSLYLRNTLQMSHQDKLQLVSSLLIIPLLIPHVFALKMAEQTLGASPTFTSVLTIMWLDLPLEGLRQVLLVIVVWVHGCIGLFTWLRLKPWWNSLAHFIYPLAVAIPTLALLGFVEAGREAIQLHQDKQMLSAKNSPAADVTDLTMLNQKIPKTRSKTAYTNQVNLQLTPQVIQALILKVDRIKRISIYCYFALLMALFIARHIRIRKNRASVELHYGDGEVVRSKVGPNLLEIAILNDIPHANLCHGKGRCGTCRIRILSSSSQLTPVSTLEQAMLTKLQCSDDTRLACQTSPSEGVIHLEKLLAPDVQPQNLHVHEKTAAVDQEALS
ncbi:MAG: 2Fe-2S iron-sulfur cluster-binding protein [Oceanospirillaceae bacterium]